MLGLTEVQDKWSREKWKPTPVSPKCLKTTDCGWKGVNDGERTLNEALDIWSGNGFIILTLNCDHCEQVEGDRDMAHLARGRGHGG